MPSSPSPEALVSILTEKYAQAVEKVHGGPLSLEEEGRVIKLLLDTQAGKEQFEVLYEHYYRKGDELDRLTPDSEYLEQMGLLSDAVPERDFLLTPSGYLIDENGQKSYEFTPIRRKGEINSVEALRDFADKRLTILDRINLSHRCASQIGKALEFVRSKGLHPYHIEEGFIEVDSNLNFFLRLFSALNKEQWTVTNIAHYLEIIASLLFNDEANMYIGQLARNDIKPPDLEKWKRRYGIKEFNSADEKELLCIYWMLMTIEKIYGKDIGEKLVQIFVNALKNFNKNPEKWKFQDFYKEYEALIGYKS